MSHSFDLAARFWDDIVSRPSGPLAFRFILQPAMATLLAIRDGFKDAHDGRTPYLWAVIHGPAHRAARLREGFQAVSRVMLLGAAMDAIYQLIELQAFHPLQLVVIVLSLAFVPYLLLRGPAARLVRLWRMRQPHRSGSFKHG